MNSPGKRSALESLVQQGKNDELRSIVQRTNPCDLVDASGTTLLHLAAKYNNAEFVEYLLRSNCNVDARNSSGAMPLLVAAKNRSFDAFKILLESDANVFAGDAADVTVLDILRSESANLPSDVFECFYRAVKRNFDVDTMAEILVNKLGCPLEMVVSLRDARLTEAFLKRLTAIEPRLHQSPRSALDQAMKSLDLENVRVLLLHRGPESDATMAQFYANLADVIYRPNADLAYFETYVRAIVDWDAIRGDDLEHLHRMFVEGERQVVGVLLECEVAARVRDKFGIDLIAGLFANRKISAIELMENRRFDANARGSGGYSPLHFALRSVDSARNVEFLLDLGADLRARDHLGRTPLLDNHAWIGDECPAARMLLQRGADVQAVDKRNVAVYEVTDLKNIRAVIVPHLAILKARNVGLSANLEKLINLKAFVGTYEECCRQLELLYACKLTESTTLFDVLAEKAEKVAGLLRGEDFTLVVARFCSANRIIPYYSCSLDDKLKRALVLYRSRCNMAAIVSAYVKSPVDCGHLIIEKIFSFLTYRDARSLV